MYFICICANKHVHKVDGESTNKIVQHRPLVPDSQRGALKMLDVKMTDVKLMDQFAGHEIAGHEIDGPMCRT